MSKPNTTNYFDKEKQPLNHASTAAIDEYSDMLNHPEEYKRYDSFGEILDELRNEE